MSHAALLIGVLLAVSDVSLRVVLDPPEIPFHRQANYTIIVEAPAKSDPKLPDMVELFGGLAVYGIPEYSQEPVGDDRIRITETYTLDAIRAGDYAIAPATVTFGDGDTRVVASPALRVRELTEAEVEEAEKFELALALPPELAVRPFYRRWETWAVVIAGCIALFIALRMWRRRDRQVAAPTIMKKPWEVAYDRLRLLDQRGYPKSRDYGPYYVDLSAILRYYIEDRFHIHAPEQTTPEFLVELHGGDVLTTEHEAMLGQFLRHCDRVKFAQYRPSTTEMEESFTRVLIFVDETVPPEQAAQRSAAA